MDQHPEQSGREQSRSEELANSVSHGVGLVAAVVATPFLIVHAVNRGDVGFIVGASIFAATMILLYAASTLYHALPSGRIKHIFRIIEHAAIFLLIAGTYTPFTLGILHGGWGWTLFGIIWGLAAIGVLLKVLDGVAHPIAFTILYLLMGWIIVIAAKPFYTHLPASGLAWLLAGGLSYTVGVAFFTTDSRLRYGHFIWHLFVMAGTTCHYFAVLWYAA
ncbi:MAG TPA: hemolysin III family protein [Gallionellaceae bacterium]